jgi:predicted AAA+ superfamily ATPase
VCSAPESPVARLTRAIEDLAADCRDGAVDSQLAERIAGLWGMIADLDPELARRRSGYDGAAQPGWPAPGT